jgi:hypothetical protein
MHINTTDQNREDVTIIATSNTQYMIRITITVVMKFDSSEYSFFILVYFSNCFTDTMLVEGCNDVIHALIQRPLH